MLRGVGTTARNNRLPTLGSRGFSLSESWGRNHGRRGTGSEAAPPRSQPPAARDSGSKLSESEKPLEPRVSSAGRESKAVQVDLPRFEARLETRSGVVHTSITRRKAFILSPGKTRRHRGSNIVSYDVARPWQNAATFVARRAHTNVSEGFQKHFFLSRTQMLRAWQNESTFGKHDHASNVAPQRVLVLPEMFS